MKSKPKTKAAVDVALPKRGRGRPTTYNAEIVKKILNMAAQGPTEVDIAKALGVPLATIYQWKDTHPDFSEALKNCREVADNTVVRSLRERALGYKCPAIKIHFSKFGKVSTFKYTEHYPPDVTACIFWLKNRNKAEWRDVQERQHSGEIGGTGNQTQIIVTLPANGRTKEENEAKPA